MTFNATRETLDNDTFVVSEKHSSDTLASCVEKALENYLQQLNGHSTASLHQMLITEVERPLFKIALQHTGSNQSQAAKLLGISRSTLRKKMATYQLD